LCYMANNRNIPYFQCFNKVLEINFNTSVVKHSIALIRKKFCNFYKKYPD
jgi:hypothetical protein